MSNYALEIDFKKVKGYKELSFKGKQLLHKTYDKHNRIIGIENKVNWRPKHVKELCDCLVVSFDNNNWLRYYLDGTWG